MGKTRKVVTILASNVVSYNRLASLDAPHIWARDPKTLRVILDDLRQAELPE